MDGADAGTDVEHARSTDAFAADDLDQFSCRGVQLPLVPSSKVGLGIETVVPEAGEILLAAEPTPRVSCHWPIVRRASTCSDSCNLESGSLRGKHPPGVVDAYVDDLFAAYDSR
jgi:hypothetical protein